jgi:hypothetical protein
VLAVRQASEAALLWMQVSVRGHRQQHGGLACHSQRDMLIWFLCWPTSRASDWPWTKEVASHVCKLRGLPTWLLMSVYGWSMLFTACLVSFGSLAIDTPTLAWDCLLVIGVCCHSDH